MKILVTGSNGLLGHKLTELIQSKGEDEVIGLSRSIYDVNFPFFQGDITDKDRLDNILEAVKPDVVINTAAMTNVDQCESDKEACWEINVEGVKNLVNGCAKVDSALLHVSTDFIFDGTSGPLEEDAIPSPVNFYGKSKLEAEEVVKNSAIEWSIARTVLVYGCSKTLSRSNIVLWVRDSLMQNKKIQVVDDQFRTPTLAEDLAAGCYLMARKRAKGIYHISGEDFMTPYEIALRTAAFFNLDASLISKTNSDTFKQPAARPLRTGFIIDKAKDDLGYRPHSFEEGLEVLSAQLP